VRERPGSPEDARWLARPLLDHGTKVEAHVPWERYESRSGSVLAARMSRAHSAASYDRPEAARRSRSLEIISATRERVLSFGKCPLPLANFRQAGETTPALHCEARPD